MFFEIKSRVRPYTDGARIDLTTDREKPEVKSPLSDDTLRLYLLGSLAENERLAIDELLLVDDELAERVELTASVLIDEYASKKLDSSERELFESNFLVTDERRHDLQLSSSLQDYVARDSRAVEVQLNEPSWKEKLAGFFAFDSPRVWVTAASLAILVLVVGLIWFPFTQRQPNEQIAQGEVPNSSPTLPQTGSSTSPPSKPTESQTPPDSTPPATVATFVLLPGAMRSTGDMTRVVIPGGERDSVRLSLVLENPAEGNYLAELVTAEGQKVLVRPNLRPVRNGQTKIVLTVPARLLHSRDYQIKLSRKSSDGQTESVGRYYFRALEE
jgi:hypothetical protein